jgi:pyroglutamyl-peptidase
MKKVLITAFEAFAGHEFNPTEKLAQIFNGQVINSVQIDCEVLPVSFSSTFESFVSLDLKKYSAIVLTGLAYSRNSWSLENVARNSIIDSRADNDGHIQSKEILIDVNAPSEYLSSLPIRELHEQLLKDKVPSEISQDAGRYVCNYLFFKARQTMDIPCGFLHIPAPTSLKSTARWSDRDLTIFMSVFLQHLTQHYA